MAKQTLRTYRVQIIPCRPGAAAKGQIHPLGNNAPSTGAGYDIVEVEAATHHKAYLALSAKWHPEDPRKLRCKSMLPFSIVKKPRQRSET